MKNSRERLNPRPAAPMTAVAGRELKLTSLKMPPSGGSPYGKVFTLTPLNRTDPITLKTTTATGKA